MQRRWARQIGIAVAVVVGVVLLAITGAYAFTAVRSHREYAVAAQPVVVVHDSAAIARGRHLATAVSMCVECHGNDFGGKTFIDDPQLGRVVATNLTTGTGSAIAPYSDALLVRAVRHGVRHDGTPLIIMPSEDYHYLSDEDAAALVAYLRSIPPVNRTLPPSELKLLARVLYTAGQFPLFKAELIDHSAAPLARTPTETPLALGTYLINVAGCTGCHGPGLSGGKIPGTPPEWKPAANITPTGIGEWTEADFVRALRTGHRPDGSAIDSIMPWKYAGQMTDDELHAIWTYLQTVPAKPFGGR